MIIGVVSDTHMPRAAGKLPSKLAQAFRGVDLILHLGDWVTMEVYDQLSALAPVDGVAGNNDGMDIVSRFGKKKVLTLEGFRIGLVHGHEPVSRLATPEKALRAFEKEQVQCVLFGHSHQPYHLVQNGVLLFNPGSPTDKRREQKYSFGLLQISNGALTARHIFYDHKK
ncbi:metallophosphoesterase family protein [Paenibacillus caui]|uniref:metallophosphoesterase family protein n=1 Tax=Paenibacillus caui TaxID=2873927 RepID=UPI001CA92637|nr:metallophosphoesterase family protein [Paenibacillus caui]